MANDREGEIIDSHQDLVADSVEEMVRIHSRMAPFGWLFRGQSDGSLEPRPAIDREAARLARYPDFSNARKLQEKWLLEHFQRRARTLVPHEPRSDWEWLAVARHSGLWTRLLDWTTGALAALYFAVEEPRRAGPDSAVFCFAPRGAGKLPEDPFESNELAVYRPPHIFPRITAQNSCFTAHPPGFFDEDDAKWAWPRKWKTFTRTIVIPAGERRQIREQLIRLGIHRAALFPDADGLAGLLNLQQREE